MSLKSVQKLKENFSKQRRRQELQKKFAQKRKEISIQYVQKQKQTFYSLIPNINHQNYEGNRFLLSDFARSGDYSYQMLPIAFISFQYLLANPSDISSWDILTSLSYYEDFQIPQTQQFAQIFIQFFKDQTQMGSQFLNNISFLPKCSLLCCRLVDYGIIQIISQILQKNTEIYWSNSLQNASFVKQQNLQILIFNLLTALSNIFTLKPMLEVNQMERICQILKFETKSNKFLKQVYDQAIFKLISNAVSEFSSQRNVLQLVINFFQQTLRNTFFTYEEQSLLFMDLCVKNKVRLNQKLIENLIISIKCKNNKNKVVALNLLKKILMSSQKHQMMEVQTPKVNYLGSNFLTNTLPSLQEFSSMFSVKNQGIKSKQNSQEQEMNFLMTYSILFNQNYQNNLKALFEIYQNSSLEIQQVIVSLIKAIIECQIRQAHNYEPRNLIFGEKKFTMPEMEEYLFLTVQMEEFYIFLSECLKSSRKQIIKDSLQIIKKLLLQFQQKRQQHEQMDNQIGFELILNSLQKFGIYFTLNSLIEQQNSEITQLTETILNFIEETN